MEQVFFQIYLFPLQIYLCISTLRERERKNLGLSYFSPGKLNFFEKYSVLKKISIRVRFKEYGKKGRKEGRKKGMKQFRQMVKKFARLEG